MSKHRSALLLQSALVGAGLIAFPLGAQAGVHFTKLNCKPVSVGHPSMGNIHVYAPTTINNHLNVVNNNSVTNNINNSMNLLVYKPVTVTNNINNSSTVNINKPIEVYSPITHISNINNSSNVNITNNIDRSTNVSENLSINVNKNIAVNSYNRSFSFGGTSSGGSHSGGGNGGGHQGGGNNNNSGSSSNSNSDTAFQLAQQAVNGFLSNDGIETNSGIGTFNGGTP